MNISWVAILRHYDRQHRPRLARERSWFATCTTIEEAITRAALAIDPQGKRYQHQRRIPRRALLQAYDALQNRKARLSEAKDFEELFTITGAAVQDIYRTGELYQYDTALRLGYYRNLLPTRVYLHAGTRDGAIALNLPQKKGFLLPEELPAPLCNRPAYESEDILCIYKKDFTL